MLTMYHFTKLMFQYCTLLLYTIDNSAFKFFTDPHVYLEYSLLEPEIPFYGLRPAVVNTVSTFHPLGTHCVSSKQRTSGK